MSCQLSVLENFSFFMQHRFYGSPVKSPIGESSFITHVQCALINFTLKYKINSKNNDSIHDPHLFYVHILLTTFPPHTFYSFDHSPIFIVGGGTRVFSDPSLQHPTLGKPQMLLQKQPGQQAFPIELLRESQSGSKKTVEGGGGGEKRFLLSPPPPPSFIFFCSCSSFLDEPREETLATQATTETTYFLFCCF